MGLKRGKTFKLSLIAIFSVLLFLISQLHKSLPTIIQVIFAVILTIGVLLINSFGGAIMITSLAGLLYSFTSHIGFLMLIPWIVRGAVVDILFKLFKIYGSNLDSLKRHLLVALGMTIGSVCTGLTQLFVIVFIIKAIPFWGASIVFILILNAAVQTTIGSFIASKYLINRIMRLIG